MKTARCGSNGFDETQARDMFGTARVIRDGVNVGGNKDREREPENSLRGSSVEHGTMQRRSAWPLAQGGHAQVEKCKQEQQRSVSKNNRLIICIYIYIYIYTHTL